ncbi:HYR domain-containing protein [Myxococcus stipitatus]|uniref:ELWxxDGT repeat protein n=1 Tax=Myxococcus stipitatus TaxID=83455 RepID=UPI001F48F3C9|nr:ELWxxDGT repeat protein [Myxococcus stipitatus]MCE9668424.1 HYR domain-containing protein [Myxococcus stipitatus]
MTHPKVFSLTGALLATCVGVACVDTSEPEVPLPSPASLQTRTGALALGAPYLVKNLVADEPTNATRIPFGLQFHTLGATTFFVWGDALNGMELWKTDGTRAGTSMLRDLAPGPASSSPSDFTSLGEHVYFNVDGAPRKELWRTDGTVEGTIRVASAGGILTSNGSTLYVLQPHDEFTQMTGFTLWKLDATGTGLTKVYSQGAGSSLKYYSTPPASAWLRETLFFVVWDRVSGNTLWKTDGTPEGTQRVVDPLPGNTDPGTGIQKLITAGDFVYLTMGGFEDRHMELWRTDGTPEGTLQLKTRERLYVDGPNFAPLMQELSGKLYFTQPTSDAGNELWSSDGTVAGTKRVVALRTVPEGFNDSRMFSQGGRLWFSQRDATTRLSQVFVSDGTAEGTSQVTGLDSAQSRSSLIKGVTREGAFFMRAGDWDVSLWKTDGTEAGTQRLGVTYPFSDAVIAHPTSGGRLFFSGILGHLWASDGSVEGTVDLAIPAAHTGLPPEQPFAVGGTLVFRVGDEDDPQSFQAWSSDGTSEGTQRFTQAPELSLHRRTPLGRVGGQFVYWHLLRVPGINASPTVTDGTPGGTRPLLEVESWRWNDPPPAVIFQKELFFGVQATAANAEKGIAHGLWKSDGTPEGTRLVAAGMEPALFVTTPERLFFSAGPSTHDQSLWTSDGTPEGTRQLIRLEASRSDGPLIHQLLALGSRVLFWSHTPTAGHELRVSDGTPEGTRVLKHFDGTHFLMENASRMAVLDGHAFFVTKTPDLPAQLWRTDGDSVVLLANFDARNDFELPTHLTAFRGELWFWARDDAHGIELWKSDGTPEGTVLAKDLSPGPANAIGRPGPLVPLGPNGPLLFTASDGKTGAELWQTDGTAEGTTLVADIASGPESSTPGDLVVTPRHVFMVAWTKETGRELWALERPAQDTTAPVVTCPSSLTEQATSPSGFALSRARVTATDDSGAEPLLRYDPPLGKVCPVGTTDVTVTAVDGSGNMSSCSFPLTVSLLCPETQRLEADASGHAAATWPDIITEDSGSDVVLETSIPKGTALRPGTHAVTVTAHDPHGSSSTCTFSIVVVKPGGGGGGCQQAGSAGPLGLGLALFSLWWMRTRRRGMSPVR